VLRFSPLQVRTDVTYPAGFMDVIELEKTNEHFRWEGGVDMVVSQPGEGMGGVDMVVSQPGEAWAGLTWW